MQAMNNLRGVDGPTKSRKLAPTRKPGRGLKSRGNERGRGGKQMSDDLKFTVQRPPAYGELTDVLPGLFWVRLPMPTAPNHVNCWLLDNGPGWTMVDCGMNTDDTFRDLGQAMAGAAACPPVAEPHLHACACSIISASPDIS